MLRFFWIIVSGFCLINGAIAQIEEPLPWSIIQKNLNSIDQANALQYLDSIWQKDGAAYSVDDRIQFVLKKGKLIEKRESPGDAANFLFSDSIHQSILSGHPSPATLGSFYRARARLNRRSDNFARAIENYDLALAHYPRLADNVRHRVECYYFAGQCAIRMLNYEKAINYFKQVLDSKKPGKRKINSQRFLLMALNYTGQAEEVVQLYQHIENFDEIKVVTQIRMQKEFGIASAKLGDKRQAEKEVQSILRKGKAGEAAEKGLYSYSLYQAAEIYAANNQFSKAADLYLKNIESDHRVSIGEKDRELAKKYERLGTIYFEAGDYKLALEASQNALIQIFPQFNDLDISANPSISSIQRESFMMSIPALKAQCLKAIYLQSGDLSLLQNASSCHALSLKAVQLLLAGYHSEESKLFLQSYISDYLEEAIATEYTLATQANDREALSRAFNFMSTQKAIVLREALIKNAALIKADIPFSVQEADKQMQEKIHLLRLELSQANDQMAQDSLQQLLNEQIGNYQGEALLMQKEYPAYAGLLTQAPTIALQSIQEKLNSNQALLQFFWGQRSIYAFWIEKSKVQLKAIPTENIDLKLSDFIARLNDRKVLENDPQEFFTKSHELAKELFIKPQGTLKNEIVNITIVPDGPLFFLPFGCLTTSAKNDSYARADYLLNQYIFTYAYSPDLYFSPSIPRADNGQALGVFPFLENKKSDFAVLESGTTEVKHLGRQIKVLSGSEATYDIFRKAASPYSLIHLSTHANTGNANRPPSIEFIDSTLYLPQLYSSRLSADLVVLSACQTSLGDLQEGEGAMSLARGFFYAGANNLISTLWSVNDIKTSELLNDFYFQAIEEDLPLSAALTVAQRNYLQNPKNLLKSSPFYWAGIHLNGKDGKLQLKSGIKAYWFILLLPILAGLWFFMKKKNS